MNKLKMVLLTGILIATGITYMKMDRKKEAKTVSADTSFSKNVVPTPPTPPIPPKVPTLPNLPKIPKVKPEV